MAVDLNQSPYLLPLKNLLENNDLIYQVKPGRNIEDSFFFIQDKYMQKYFSYYNKCICVDKCKLIELKLDLYLFLSLDSNGFCEIFAIGLVQSCEKGIRWLCDTLKKHNPNWVFVSFIWCDKTLVKNSAFRSAFLNQNVQTSFFHSFVALKKELSNIYNINHEPERLKIKSMLTLFEKMMFSSDHSKYLWLVQEVFPEMFPYFLESWHREHYMWILEKQCDFKSLMKSFNIYLSSLRESLLPFIISLKSIEEVLELCFSFIKKKRVQKFKNITFVFLRQCVNEYQSELFNHCKNLTPFARVLFYRQRMNIKQIDLREINIGYYITDAKYITSEKSCTCSFYTLLLLPCFHMFVVRIKLCLPLYDHSLYPSNWLQSNYQETFIELFNMFSVELSNFDQKNVTFISYFKNYFCLSDEFWKLLSKYPEKASEENISTWQQLLSTWNKELYINTFTSQNTDLSSNRIVLPSMARQLPVEILVNRIFIKFYGISLDDIINFDNNVC